jgi:hypothetical protein
MRRDSRTTQSSAKHAYTPTFRYDSVVSIAAYLEIVFDTTRYILLSPKIEFYIDKS